MATLMLMAILTIGAGTTLDVSVSNYSIDLKGNWNNSGTHLPIEAEQSHLAEPQHNP